MIEIKFIDKEGNKHYSLFSAEKVSSIADAAELILTEPSFTEAMGIFDVKVSDIHEVYGADESNLTEEGAFYKCVLKHQTIDNKTIKYTVLMFAHDINDAHAQIPDILAQTDMQDAEVLEIKHTAFTDVIC